MDHNIYITINHLEPDYLLPAKSLTLCKEHENAVDDESIAVMDGASHIGYVANSVATVARGTWSAGRLYDKMGEKGICRVLFVLEEAAIAEVEENDGSVSQTV